MIHGPYSVKLRNSIAESLLSLLGPSRLRWTKHWKFRFTVNCSLYCIMPLCQTVTSDIHLPYCVFRLISRRLSSDAHSLPKRPNTSFNTRRKFEIKINQPVWGENCKTCRLTTAPGNQNGPSPPPPVSLPSPAPFPSPDWL